MDNTLLDFDIPKDYAKIIKVIGVGGGGGNAVSHMYKKGIHDVSFILCNTDNQALKRSDVPNQIVLGREITNGLGAGNKPDIAEKAAESSTAEIQNMLSDGTKMVFITAGMGGGTGTGAAPVIARIAKEMDILTVGIVTIPFLFEGRPKIVQALEGVEKIAANVDALLVINNELLREIYSDLSLINAFGKADDTLATAAKSIAEIITLPGHINLDFADVNTTMKNGGVALMSNGYGEGEGRVRKAVEDALHSPLLSNNDVRNARKILFNVYFSEESELQMEEMKDVHNFMAEFNPDIHVIWGTAIDNSLGQQVKITIIATGFTMNDAISQVRDAQEMRNSFQSEEELRKADEQKKRKEREEQLIKGFYGKSAEKVGRFIPRPNIVVLSDKEMEDDSIISLLEDNPTYNRDPNLIIRKRGEIAKLDSAREEENTEMNTESSSETGSNYRISFK
ncbi:cell division protein FtsZ [Parabacteroides sp. OttesenSCG-928-G07]|nr:cell division protein FtsZ [Parabacteroides sp. OttesenSCG-928-G07]